MAIEVVTAGTDTTVLSTTSTVTDASYSTDTPDSTFGVTQQARAQYANIVLEVTGSTAFDAGGAIHLYTRLLNIDSTDDEPIPDTGFPRGSVCTFLMDAISTIQRVQCSMVELPVLDTGEEMEFYVRNNAGATMSANWTLTVKPRTFSDV